MRKPLLPLSFVAMVLIAGCGSNKQVVQMEAPEAQPMQSAGPLEYSINLNDRADDVFHVTLDVDDLGPENAIFQFASTAPGTYQVADIGRFVRSFEALDGNGVVIEAENVSTNQWRISAPERVARITYSIAETWDTPVEEHSIYRMAGTSIEDDHVLINPHAVMGFPTGMQDRQIRLSVAHPESWLVGTALAVDRGGAFMADDFDHAVDSPILLGRLSKASLDVRGTQVDIFTYSKTDYVKSADILEAVDEILASAGDFLIDLPVDRYTLLFHFEDISVGAWEHSYSSEYIYAENDFDQVISTSIPNVVAHEFFHVITPLNIHSEIIEQYNFVKPVPSEHLWLYEGTTEWAAHAMQLRAGLIDLDDYLDRMEQKLRTDDHFDKSYSLSKLALTSFEPEGYKQYSNIYMRGALVAGLLDIRLLELSGGVRGLREVLLELSEKYGKNRAFNEKTFIDDFVALTYPEIGDFFRDYVRGAKPLPVAEYYGKLGVTYQPEVAAGEEKASTGLHIMFNGTSFVIAGVAGPAEECGFKEQDEIALIGNQPLDMTNYQEVFAGFGATPVNEDYEITVRRGGEETSITCQKVMEEQVVKHVLEQNPDATPEQLALRKSWMVNLQPS